MSLSGDRHFMFRCQIPTCRAKLRWAEYRTHIENVHKIYNPRDQPLVTYRTFKGTRRQRCAGCGQDGPNLSLEKHWQQGCPGPAVPPSSNGKYDDRLNRYSFTYPGVRPPRLKPGEQYSVIIPVFKDDLNVLKDIRRKYLDLTSNNETSLALGTTEAASDIDSDGSREETKDEMTFAEPAAAGTDSQIDNPSPAFSNEQMPAKVGAARETPALQLESGMNLEILPQTKPSADAAVETAVALNQHEQTQTLVNQVESDIDDHLLLFWDNTNAHHGFVHQFNTLLKKRQRFDELSEETYSMLENYRARDRKRFPKLRYLGGYQ